MENISPIIQDKNKGDIIGETHSLTCEPSNNPTLEPTDNPTSKP